MLKNYFKTGSRYLWKTKSFSLLNIVGLAVGIAAAGLIFLWVEDERSYNDYFKNKEHIYSVKNHQTYEGVTFTFDATPGVLAPALKAEVPGFKHTARSSWTSKKLFTIQDKNIYENGRYVDQSFLNIFDLRFIKPPLNDTFSQVHSLLISESMAKKFFKTTEVVGQKIKVDNEQEYYIKGVFRDLPKNVSMAFDWLAPFTIYEEQNTWLRNWGNNGIITYAEMDPSADVSKVNTSIYNFIKNKESEAVARLSVYPMERWRLYNKFVNGKEEEGRIKYVRLFFWIACIILVIACINFMNLATARSEKRAREVGVRKTLGARKRNLIPQFIAESFLIAALASIIAIIIMACVLGPFNTMVEKTMSLGLADPSHWLVLLAICLICGIVAGSYPAFYLSSFNPINVLKGLKIKTGGASNLRKGLVVFQFAISVVLIISTILVYQQIKHVQNREIGYNKEGMVYMPLRGDMKKKFFAIKNELLNTGVAKNATLSTSNMVNFGSNTGNFSWPGKDPQKQVLITVERVSPEYVNTFEVKLKEGRNFGNNIPADSNNILINESLADIIGSKDIIGSQVTQGDGKYTVIGVMKNFYYNNMYSEPAPMIVFSDTSYNNFLSVRLNKQANENAAIEKMQQIISTHNPGYPVEYKYLDDDFDSVFKLETLIGRLSLIFASLAIIISCLGLFGLAAYTAEQRTKEMAIRKVMGASMPQLASLLSKDFLRLVLLSCIIGFPIAWWVMSDWLAEYEYRIRIEWWVFVGSLLLAMVIALSTVSYQAIRVAVMKPVTNLKSE